MAVIAATALMAPWDTSAQAKLEGQVIDAESGSVLPGAHVSLAGPSETGAVTDLDGRFLIEVPAGEYTVTVSFVGYRPYRQEALRLRAGTPASLQIQLEPTGIEVNPITITASRRAERALGSASSVSVLLPAQIAPRTALTAAEHLKDSPSVDLVSTGIASSRVVVRGFNDNLASSLLTLVDHRIARVPSVRLTALQLIPVSSGDIEQIEVVSGPASALYGPNAANGVVHVISRSPFDRPGSSISLAGGQRDVLLGSFRHADAISPRLAYKVTGQYYSGTDFEFFDPQELEAREHALATGAQPDTLRIAARDFGVRNLALTGVVEWRPGNDVVGTLSTGVTRGTNIEITPTGAAQVVGARLGYLQARLNRRNLFVQAYHNRMNSGESYFLRTGEGFIDRSRLYALQVQHQSDWRRRHALTYGADVFFTQPDGDGTINGRYENEDDILELGGYAQVESSLASRWALTVTGRLDYHDRMRQAVFSPRAALVFKPGAAHTLRLTYNRAFRTPRANDLFSDVLGRRDALTLGRMQGLLGFAPTTDLRVQGMLGGFSFARDDMGRPVFRSPFAPLLGRDRAAQFSLDDPLFSAAMWDVVRQSAVSGLASSLVEQGLLAASDQAAVESALDALLPTEMPLLPNQLQMLDLERQTFRPVDDVDDVPALEITRIESIEAGYKGLVGGAVVVGIDAYWTRVRNFVGPFVVGTPNVFITDATTLSTALRPLLEQAAADPANAAAAAALDRLDGVLLGSNGSGVDEAAFLAGQIGAAIPFGTVSPREAFDPVALLLMRRNFGDVSLWGTDVSATLYLSERLQIGGMLSAVSDNYFDNVDGVDDVALNAPKLKGGGFMQFSGSDERLSIQLRWRAVGGYPVRSDVYIGRVDRFSVFDVSAMWRPRFLWDARIAVTVQNMFDNTHREFVDVAEIGRLAMLRVTHDL